MRKSGYYEAIRAECEKLNRLVDEALKNGTPIDETYAVTDQYKKIKCMTGETLQSEAVQAQSQRVDELIENLEGERERNGR